MMLVLVGLLAVLRVVVALGQPNPLVFQRSEDAITLAAADKAFTIDALPILYDSKDPEAVHIAVGTFAKDIHRVTGVRPAVHADTLPSNVTSAIVVGTIKSDIVRQSRRHHRLSGSRVAGVQIPLDDDTDILDGEWDTLDREWDTLDRESDTFDREWDTLDGKWDTLDGKWDTLDGKWESYEARVIPSPFGHLDEALVIAGSDKRGTIYALYSLSEAMGVSPWHWWADIPPASHSVVAFKRSATYAHGPPTVKYRGFFLNDEQPVLWNWAAEKFNTGDGPPFQTGMYEKVFELLLRLKGNYMWPAMWESMFSVDGQGLAPPSPEPGPNQVLAQRMGVVMGTSHHEPMGRNQREWEAYGSGPWNFSGNAENLRAFWKYGAERAQGCETLFTVGMRGDGDMPLDGAQASLLENITAEQQEILRHVYGTTTDIPQTWAMYKEVMSFYADGLKVPDDVTPLLSDDNWGNIMSVPPQDGRKHKSGAGLYYHADYVGDPRSYKWINSVSLAKMWHQLYTARQFDIDKIWILNVGDLKMLETPLEYFMSIAYDAGRWPRNSLLEYLQLLAERDFGAEGIVAREIACIMARYSQLASRRKPELLDADTYSLLHYNEAEEVLLEWHSLQLRSHLANLSLPADRRPAYYQLLLVQVCLQQNLHEMYVFAAKSRLYALQGRSAANLEARKALAAFEKDWSITSDFHKSQAGKWNHMLAQTHIGYQYWQAPVRSSLPLVSFVREQEHSWDRGKAIHTRYTVSDSAGAWPGDNMHNCAQGYNCPDPTLWPISTVGGSRRIYLSSGGPEQVQVTVTSEDSWIDITDGQTLVTLSPDGSQDNWVTVRYNQSSLSPSELNRTSNGTVTLASSDGTKVNVTVPLHHANLPPQDFHGHIEQDGYVVITPECVTRLASQDEYLWAEIPFYGRRSSGMTMFPATSVQFEAGRGPRAEYDFWATSTGGVEVTLMLGPTLNIIPGHRLAIAAQLDNGHLHTLYPVPESPPGTLPKDWDKAVTDGVRRVSFKATIDEPGIHTLVVHGMTTGVVLDTIQIDFGGISGRGYSYLGPPQSPFQPFHPEGYKPDGLS